MELRQDVRVRTDTGQDVKLRSAFVDFKAGTVVSNEAVTVSLANGVIEATGIEVKDNGKVLHFSGPGPHRVRGPGAPGRRGARGRSRRGASRPADRLGRTPSAAPVRKPLKDLIAMRLPALAAALLALAGAAEAQTASGKDRPATFGDLGSNKEPIKIDADRLDVFDKESRAVFAGNVVAVQGDTTMKCTTLTVFYEPRRQDGAARPAPASAPAQGAADSQIKKIDCKGPVTIVSKTQVATGDNATFDRVANKVLLIGNVALSRRPERHPGRAPRLRPEHRRRQCRNRSRRPREGPVRARQQPGGGRGAAGRARAVGRTDAAPDDELARCGRASPGLGPACGPGPLPSVAI